MDGVSFEAWLDAIRLLTARQRQAGFACLTLADADDDWDPIPSGVADGQPAETVRLTEAGAPALPASAAAAAASRIEHSGCPHCASRDLQRWGRVSDLPRYRCRACRRTFNGLTGTPMARLRKKDRWAAQAEALIAGDSVVKAAKRCGVAKTTAFRWRHRFLAASALDKPARLSGIVEADETFILESFKGRRSDHKRVGVSLRGRRTGIESKTNSSPNANQPGSRRHLWRQRRVAIHQIGQRGPIHPQHLRRIRG